MDRNDPLWQHWSNGWKLHGTKILPMGKGLPIMPQITPEQPAPQPVGERLCEAVDVRAGERLLDVAAGNGNASLAAARRHRPRACIR